MDGSRRGVCSHKEARDLQRGSVTPVPAVDRTEVEAHLRGFSTVLDVKNHVLGIQRTSCTKPDSESVSDCSITI